MLRLRPQARAADDPDAVRGSRARVLPDAPHSRRRLRAQAGHGRRHGPAGAAELPGRDRHRSADVGAVRAIHQGPRHLRFRQVDVDGAADHRRRSACASSSRCRSPSWRPSPPSCSPSRSAPSRPCKQNTWIDYVVRAFSIAGVAMPSFWLGILIILGILITSKAWFGIALDAAHHLRADLGRPPAQPEHADLAGARHRLSLFGGGHPHDPLGHARGAARGLRAHRARQGRVPQADRAPACAAQCAAAGDHHHRHRVRLPDGRPRRHRAGVQPQRARQAVRRVGARTRTTT